jgi:tight adherence protein B
MPILAALALGFAVFIYFRHPRPAQPQPSPVHPPRLNSPKPWVAWAARRRAALLGEQLPQLLESLSAAMRAGQSLPQALESARADMPEPSAAWLEGVQASVRLGLAPERVLEEAADALKGALAADLRLLATGVAIQRDSGGDLAGLLDQLAETLRERQRLLAQARALTAQGRLSAWVVGLLPVALMIALQMIDPEMMSPLFNTAQGWAMLAAAVVLESLGVLVLRAIVRIEA